ncbi:Hypothetical protein Tpal_911 [Trichococcus palustris]|jgi:hypothetical protein|uniref:DUF2798 domain-containing protein n=1 Tax=Trichococcus palustris TaxID=140314 RepID=A0A143YFS4_9LACT|nr:DUF2798 domain-containing protein [Trichococcus palustris]CZQ87543.1 Hypothetical protein Tpal_911 [Trichococcus palustris]SFK78631.1 hypothetical protein SAMN04488076_10547 [Trichococcus palustris]
MQSNKKEELVTLEEENRLPQNGKEGLLYGAIITVITCLVMSTLNIGTSFGRLDKEVLTIILKCIPIVFVIAMLLENFVVGRIAEKLAHKFSEPTDGFNANILFRILFTVTGMSICMTIIGDMVGHGISWGSFERFPSHWPRNFAVALWCELLVAQPPARFVMKKLHEQQERTLAIDAGAINFD